MAFESFLTVDKLKPRKGRRITFLISLAVHGAMLAVGVAMSFAGVDELAPKNGRIVTFYDMPTPPPPPAGRKKKDPPKAKTPTKTVRPANSIVAPTEHTKTEKTDDTTPPGIDDNGNDDGDPNTIGISPPTETERKTLPPNVAKGFLAIDPQAPQHRPRMPAGVRHAGMSVWALLRACVDRNGNVVEVSVLKGDDASVNAAFIEAIRTWRYTPFKVDGRPVPFCTNVRYEVQTTN